MKQIDIREGARRQHRAVSLFAVIQCWTRNLDGVAFPRSLLERMLGLDRFKATRIEWLEEDLSEFFPYHVTYWATKQNNSFSSMFVSRCPLEEFIPTGKMTTNVRIKMIPKKGPRIALFQMWDIPEEIEMKKRFETIFPFYADAANFDERFLSSYLALLTQGQISPHDLPPLKTEED